MQRMPSSLRSKTHAGSLKRASVSVAFIAAAPVGGGPGRANARSPASRPSSQSGGAPLIASASGASRHRRRPSNDALSRRRSLARDLLDRAPGLHRARLRALRVAPRVGALVAALDQQPLRLAAGAGAV